MNKVLRATLVSAVVITTVIGIASFVLSFAALWDLATMAGVPRNLSWLWPVIVDGTILQATISVIALAQFDEQRSGRRFFWAVLVIAALVSIGANAMHAFISQTGTLHPALSATIATVAPVSLLAATHGLGILVRLPSRREAVVAPFTETRREQQPVHPEASPPEVVHVTGESPKAPESAGRVLAAEPVVADRPALQDLHEYSHSTLAARGDDEAQDPLADVDRWILDEDRSEDLYPVEAP